MDMLRALAEQSGDYSILPKPIKLSDGELRFWGAFWELRNKYSFDPTTGAKVVSSITAIDVLQYCELLGINSLCERRKYLRFILALDRFFFDFKVKK